MSLEEDIKQCSTPTEALLMLARAIDDLRAATWEPQDPWSQPLDWGDTPPADLGPAMEVQSGDDWSEITIRPVSDEKQEKRELFAQEVLMLENLDGIDDEEAYAAYAKGGPLWLHVFDREYVMGLSIQARMGMVADVLEEDREAAHLLSRDILKNPTPQELGEFLAIRPEIEAEMNA